jgi:hypothetical protein
MVVVEVGSGPFDTHSTTIVETVDKTRKAEENQTPTEVF